MKGLLILALVTCALQLSHFSVPVGATDYHAAAELHRSMARYQQFFEHEDTIALMRKLLQVDKETEDDLDLAGKLNSIDQTKMSVEGNSNENPKQGQFEEKQEQPVEEKVNADRGASSEETSMEKGKGGKHVDPQQEGLESQQLVDEKALHNEVTSTEQDAEKLVREDDQLEQHVIERPEPGMENSTESQTNETSNKVQQHGQDEDMKVIQEGKVEEETIVERPAEENSNENVELDQRQEQGRSEPDVEFEQQQEKERKEGVEEGNKSAKKEPFVFPEPYLLGPKIDDWDEQRANWLEQNPHLKSTDGKPKVLIVTGSQPEPCPTSAGDYFHMQSLKLKIDYARMHNYEIYYSLAWLDPLFGGYWVKLPIIRKLMLTHPEIEWFFWIDSDAVFTDMLFEAPFHTYEGYNMVMWGWNYGVYEKKLWTAFNAGVFIIRNCQWSLDLIDKWSPMGPAGPVREEYGHILSAFLTGRDLKYGDNYPADDQSALVYLMIKDETVKSKVKLVEHTEYMISGWWIDTLPLYNASMEKFHPGFGDQRWPFITHFTGCSPCGGEQGSADYDKCLEGFETAYNFADNQVLAFMGFQHESLSSANVTRIRNETDRPLELIGVNPWEERIAQVATSGLSYW